MPAPDGHSAQQARAAIQAALGQTGFCLPGSIVICRTRCGKPRCACAADPPVLHGPYIQWTRTVKGKTVTRRLTQAPNTAPTPPGSPTPGGCAHWPPSSKPSRWKRWPAPKAGPRSPPAPRRRRGPAQPGPQTRTTPKHPNRAKHRETGPLNPAPAPQKHPIAAGQQGFVGGPPKPAGQRHIRAGRPGHEDRLSPRCHRDGACSRDIRWPESSLASRSGVRHAPGLKWGRSLCEARLMEGWDLFGAADSDAVG